MRAVTRERWIDPQSVNCELMASDGWLPSDAAALVAPFYDFPFEAFAAPVSRGWGEVGPPGGLPGSWVGGLDPGRPR